MTPRMTVTASASTGEARLQNRDAWGRGSSLSMPAFLHLALGGTATSGGFAQGLNHPQPAHPFSDQRHGGPGAVYGRREAALGDHMQAIADLEQLFEFFAHH